MKLFKKLKQIFCFHHWIPIKIINTDVYNKYNVRYANCHCFCDKCNKEQDMHIMMRAEFQDRWNDIKG